MSLDATVAVWVYSHADGNQKVLLLAIADNINFPEGTVGLSRDFLCEYLHWTDDQLRTHENILVAIGELRISSPADEPGYTYYEMPQLPGEPDREEEYIRLRDLWVERQERRRQERLRKKEEREAKAALKNDGAESHQDGR